MRIYLAGWWHVGNAIGTNIHQYNLHTVRYPYHLESYHYMDRQIIQQARTAQTPMFLDSGAFSAMTQGVKINIKSYAKFINGNQDIIDLASNLDDTTKTEQITYDNQKYLEDAGCEIKPVFHCREDEKWLRRYIDEGYDYILLGGMVPETTKWLTGWLDHLWHHYFTNADGTARFKIHGFGLTSLPLMYRYPWYSVDSTSWAQSAKFGGVLLDIKQPDGSYKDYMVDFSNNTASRYNLDGWHYWSLARANQQTVENRLAEMEDARPKYPEIEDRLAVMMKCKQGFYPEALAESYGWRMYANLEYFRRAMERRVTTFRRKQDTLWDHFGRTG
jgi:hypothetical protein